MQISVFIATSLDGFIARENGALDWLPQDTGEDHGYNAFFSSIDTMLMGRKTYETILGFSPYPYEGKRVVVCSRSLSEVPNHLIGQLEFSAEPLPDLVRRLETEGSKHIYADGGQIITALLEAGLVNNMILTRVPVLLGLGIPLFGALSADVLLEHLETKSFSSGLVQSVYEVKSHLEKITETL
jgi:dihydrofolate reductase